MKFAFTVQDTIYVEAETETEAWEKVVDVAAEAIYQCDFDRLPEQDKE